MGSSKQAQCQYYGHQWSPWGPFHPVMHPLEPTPDEPPRHRPIEAYRWRQCLNCGADEREDYQGNKELRP